MRKDTPLTYRGALALLGKSDNRILAALDAVLGGAILASPVSPLAALWGMVDQKNEAMSLVRKLVGVAAKRMTGVKGLDRYDLIAAAHTVILISAFFDAYRDAVGLDDFAKLELSDREKASLATGDSKGTSAGRLIDLIMVSESPMPPAGSGYIEPARLMQFYRHLAGEVHKFVSGLSASRWAREPRMDGLARAAEARYKSYFVELANDVPEFFVWASVAGQEQLSAKIRSVHSELGAAIARSEQSLGRLELILTHLSGISSATPDNCRRIVARANRSVLGDTVVPITALDHVSEVSLPTVEQIYQSPLFRVGVAKAAKPADENWWNEQPVRQNLDVFLAAHLASPQSVKTPMLLLGHPGAGKSLLTKVLAARLPASAYTAVRVPLRRVDADAPVYDQIQQALDQDTNGRVAWADLAEDEGTVRVVFLDGLDELLQASSSSRPGYMQEVAEFQRREAAQRRPVAFVVTSRTLVADRVRLASDTTLLKLDEFSDEQISAWLDVWRAHNKEGIAEGTVREVDLNVALAHRALACQPLLLMMLAVYAADPDARPLGAHLSNSAFYGQILDGFARREVSRVKGQPGDLTDLAEDQLWRLGIAAFAMFNRDRQDISDHELGMDIIALTDSTPNVRPATVGHDTIGRFFFVHTAEADGHRGDNAQQAYEFLHATFGEYLVAHFAVQELCQVVENSRRARRGGREYDDDLLFALLCHQTLASRGSILEFIAELLERLPGDVKSACAHTLESLFRGYRNRASTGSYDAYQPVVVDHLRRLAAYSANLALLRVLLADAEGVELAVLGPASAVGELWWISTVELWRAGLGEPGWESQCRALDVTDSRVVRRGHILSADELEVVFQQLRLDSLAGTRHQWGLAVEGVLIPPAILSPHADVVSLLVGEMFGGFALGNQWQRTFNDAVQRIAQGDLDPRFSRSILCQLICEHLVKFARMQAYADVLRRIEIVLDLGDHLGDLTPLVTVVAIHPKLLVDVPALADPKRYAKGALIVLCAAELAPHQEGVEALRGLRQGIERHNGVVNWDQSRDGILAIVREIFAISAAVDRARGET